MGNVLLLALAVKGAALFSPDVYLAVCMWCYLRLCFDDDCGDVTDVKL